MIKNRNLISSSDCYNNSAAALVLAFGLHLAQAYTGPLWMPRAGGDYGRPGF